MGTNGDLRITSAQLYPATGASATIWGGYETGRRLEILRQPGTESVASPLSVFGSLSLGADTVIQAGTVRAPLGSISLGQDARGSDSWRARSVELMPGSLTSVSGAGVMVPYGGTADGLTYTYAGAPLKPREQNAGGIAFSGHTLTGRQGAVLDLSGGGELRGAAFVAGRGGSVDILRTPLVNANPTFTNSAAGNAIYAIVPGHAGGYAPVAPDTAGSEPVVGQTLTLTQDAGGLKAGVYTLMPAAYALMPGAYRVELGPETLLPGAAPTPQGSLAASGYLGVSNTGLRGALPRQLLLTPGERVRSHSNYNEMSHDAFVAADAARKGGLRGQITADARTLRLNYERVLPQEGKPMLGFDGVARFAAAKGGVDGTLEVLANDVELLADGAGRTAGYTGASLSASALNRFNPVRMMVGGRLDLKPGDNYATFVSSTNNVTVRGGRAQRRRGVPDQRRHLGRHHGGRGRRHLDHRPWQAGLRFQHGLGVRRRPDRRAGLEQRHDQPAAGHAGDGAGTGLHQYRGLRRRCTGAATTLAAEGTLLVATDRAFTLADNARYGARNLLLAMSTLNLGDDAALARPPPPASCRTG